MEKKNTGRDSLDTKRFIQTYFWDPAGIGVGKRVTGEVRHEEEVDGVGAGHKAPDPDVVVNKG